MATRDHLIEQVLEFMTVIHECFVGTNFSSDRPIYAADLVAAMGWIVALRSGAEVDEIRRQILSPATEKHFGDYWRQGEWGEKEAAALQKLKGNIMK